VALNSIDHWKDKDLAQNWRIWLQELDSFSQVPIFFAQAMNYKKCKDLLMKVLAGQPDIDSENKSLADKWKNEVREASEINFKILAQAFRNRENAEMRQQCIEFGIFSGILTRLGAVSGEKSRNRIEEKVEEVKDDDELPMEAPSLVRCSTSQLDQEREKQRKNNKGKGLQGVGYSKDVGTKFDVGEYLRNAQLRAEQIKVLIDICANFLSSDKWKADETLRDQILESSLLPILEQAFRNGSFLEISK